MCALPVWGWGVHASHLQPTQASQGLCMKRSWCHAWFKATNITAVAWFGAAVSAHLEFDVCVQAVAY
jgi:hypothetical protein